MSGNNKVLAVVDDHPVVIEGLKVLLKSGTVFGHIISFTNGTDFMSYIANNPVDMVLLDMILPDTNGIALCQEIRKLYPYTIILGLSNQAERSIILQMLQHGATGYIMKSASADELLDCIRMAQDGQMAFSREVKEIIGRPAQHESRKVPSVTKRETQVIKLLSEGKTTAIIAVELHLSPFTIDTYRKNLLQKFEVKNTSELLMLAVREKLL